MAKISFRHANSRAILSMLFLFIGIFSVCAFFAENSATYLTPAILFANILLIIHLSLFIKFQNRNIFSSLSILIPIFFYLTHFLYQTTSSIGLIEYDAYIVFIEALYAKSTVLALSSFCLLLAGIYFPKFNIKKENSANTNASGAFNLIATIGSIIFFLLLAYSTLDIGIENIMMFGYNSPELMEQFSRLLDLSQKMFIVCILASVASLSPGLWQKQIVIPLMLALTYVGAFALWGYRGHTGIFLLACYMVFSIRIKPFSYRTLIMLSLFLIASWSFIGQMRDTAIGDRKYSEILADSTEKENLIKTTIRTPGQMIATISMTLNLYPDIYEYQLGKTYFNGLVYIIPNFTNSLRSDLVSYSHTLSQYYYGSSVGSGGGNKGVGATPLAEAYSNFGIFSLLIMFLFGYAVNYIDIKFAIRGNHLLLALYGILANSLLWTMRNDSFSVFRTVIYGVVLCLCINTVAKWITHE